MSESLDSRVYYDPLLFGTEAYHLFAPLGEKGLSLLLTDSIVSFAQGKKAFWTLDVVYSHLYQIHEAMTKNDTTIAFLHFDVADERCEFYAQLDSDMPRFCEQYIEFTTLDVSIELYLQDGILMFPSDY